MSEEVNKYWVEVQEYLDMLIKKRFYTHYPGSQLTDLVKNISAEKR